MDATWFAQRSSPVDAEARSHPFDVKEREIVPTARSAPGNRFS